MKKSRAAACFEAAVLSIILGTSAFLIYLPVSTPAFAASEGVLIIEQEGTAKLAKAASGFSKGNHDVAIEISGDYSFNAGKVTMDKDTFSGTLTIDDDDNFDLTGMKITVAKDRKSITYSGKLDGTSGSVSGTLKFNTALNFENSGVNNAASNVNSMKATVVKATFDTKKTSTGTAEIDAGPRFKNVDLSFPEELPLLLSHLEANLDSDDVDVIEDSVTVEVDADGGDVETIDMSETEDDTGKFLPDFPGGALEVTFLGDGESPIENNGLLELRPSDIDQTIKATYEVDDDLIDERDLDLAKTAGTISLPVYTGIDDAIILTITDPDLNDDASAIDSYSFTLEGSTGEYPLQRDADDIGDLASLEMEINDVAPDFQDDITVTLLETEENSGVFETEIDMADLTPALSEEIDLEDVIKIVYVDGTSDTTSDATSTIVEMTPMLIYADAEAFMKKTSGIFVQGYYYVFIEIEANYVFDGAVDIQEGSMAGTVDIEGDEGSFIYDFTITSLTVSSNLQTITYSGYIDGVTGDKVSGTLKFEEPVDFSAQEEPFAETEAGNKLTANIGKAKFDGKEVFGGIELG